MKTKKSGNMMASLSKLSKAFMLPIALLPIAGLFLGIGTTIMGQASYANGLWWIGRVMKMTGNIPFANLPGLFCISVAIAYTRDAGSAALTALVAWLVFNVFISAFMMKGDTVYTIQSSFKLDWNRFPTHGSQIVGLSNTEFKNYSFIMADNGYIPPTTSIPSAAGDFVQSQHGMKEALAADLSAKLHTAITSKDIVEFLPNKIAKTALNYNLMFWKGSISVNPSIVKPILGIGASATGFGNFGGSLNTGVFGGIAVGSLVAFLYNKYHKIALPSVISFFGGVRFVPIISFILVMPLALLFILIWPGLGILLNNFGKWSGTLPAGLDSLVFGLAKRALIPFGLHHVFYAPLWWTGAGGQLSDYIDASQVKSAVTLTAQGDQSIMMAILADGKLKIQDVWAAGLHVGRFQSGEFAIMMFSLPAVAVAMWLTISKENRRAALGIYIGAGLTSFLTGITEPLEFTFLFVAPLLYYTIHVPIFATSYMLANITGIKIGMTFSGGMLDWIIFGIIPSLDGNITRWWLVPIEGIGYALLEFTLFYFLIKWLKVKIPGRDLQNQEIKLYSKSDLRNKNRNSTIPGGQKTLDIIAGLGGVKNLQNVDACATRLRVTVNNPGLVDNSALKGLGAIGVIVKGNGIQAIFGGKADNIKSDINDYLRELEQKVPQQVKKGVS